MNAQNATNLVTREMVEQAEKLLGLNFSTAKNDLLLSGLEAQLQNLDGLRKFPLPNSVPSAMLFNPIPIGVKFETARRPFKLGRMPKVALPAQPQDLAFYSIRQLAALVKSRRLTSEQLTRFYLERLKQFGPKLECVVTLTVSLALAQARRADREIAAGKYRGPLQHSGKF